MEMAAVALLLGIDPVTYASRDGAERVWTETVVARAWQLRVEEVQAAAAARVL